MNTELKSRLAESNQLHLLQFYDELDSNEQQTLVDQISEIDFDQLKSLFNRFGNEDTWAELARKAQPPTALRLNDPSLNSWSRDEAVDRGASILAAGQVGMILVAGGQGSRLGFDFPKGMYPLGPVSGRTLFQIHIDKLRALNTKYGVTIPLYVMTSPATHQQTGQFLATNNRFGYPEDAIRLFCQGTMPAVDCQTGQLLLEEKGRLFLGPDGHGGMLAALDKSGCLEDMKTHGLQQIFYCQVDNPLCQICDEATIGYHVLAESEVSAQAVPKTDPRQKVGNVVEIDGKMCIIEYSDLPEEIAVQQNSDGTLKLWAGSIAVHIFNVGFLDRMSDQTNALPFHLAHKKVPYIDSSGGKIQPAEPNALKFERFVFDLLPMARYSIVIEVDPEQAFSPVKNANTETSSTPKTAQQSMIAQAKHVLAQIGVDVADDVAVEIDPHLVHDLPRLKTMLGEQPSISEPVFLK